MLFMTGLVTDLTLDALVFLDDNGIKWILPLIRLTASLRHHLAAVLLFRRVAINLRHSELWPTDPTTPGYTTVTYRLTWFPLMERFTLTPVDGGGVPLRSQSCPPYR